MEIQHVKGKEKGVVDALSKKLHGIYEMYYNQLENKFLEQLKEEANKDLEYQLLWQQMEENMKQGCTSKYGMNEYQC